MEDGFESFEYLVDSVERNVLDEKSIFEKFEDECIYPLMGLSEMTLPEEGHSLVVDSLELRDFMGRCIESGLIDREILLASSVFFGLKFRFNDLSEQAVPFFENQIHQIIFDLENNSVNFKFTDKLFSRFDGDEQRINSDEPFYTCMDILLRFKTREDLKLIYNFVYNSFLAHLDTVKLSPTRGGFKKRVYGLGSVGRSEAIPLRVVEEKDDEQILERSLSDEFFAQAMLGDLEDECIEIQPTSPGDVRNVSFTNSEDDLFIGSNPSSLEKSEGRPEELDFVPTALENPSNVQCVEMIKRQFSKYEMNLLPEVRQLVLISMQFCEKIIQFNVEQNLSESQISIHDLSMELITVILNNKRLSGDNTKNLREYVNDLVASVFDHPNFHSSQLMDEKHKDEWTYILEMLDKYTKKEKKEKLKKKRRKKKRTPGRSQLEEDLKNMELIVTKGGDSLKKQKKKRQMKKNDFVLLRRKKDVPSAIPTLSRKKKRKSKEEDDVVMEDKEMSVPSKKKKKFWGKLFSPIASCFVGTSQ